MDDHCLLCFNDGTKLRPLSYPCTCSLSVHQDCLLSWFSSRLLSVCQKNRSSTEAPSLFASYLIPPLEILLGSDNDFHSNIYPEHTTYSNYLRRGGVSSPPPIGSTGFGTSLITSSPLYGDATYQFSLAFACPQCRKPIIYSSHNYSIFWFTEKMKSMIKRLTLLFTGSVLTISPLIGLINLTMQIAEYHNLFLGFIGADKIQSSILNIKKFPLPNLDQALDQGLITFDMASEYILSFFPLVYFLVNPIELNIGLIFHLIHAPLLFSQYSLKFSTIPSKICSLLPWIKLGCSTIYRLTFNIFYFNWYLRLQPWGLKEKISPELNNEIQEYFRDKENKNLNWGWNWLFVIKTSLKIDFSELFGQTRFLNKLIDMLIIPIVGGLIGKKLVIKFPFFVNNVNKIVNTPDECEFVINLISCGGIIIMKTSIEFVVNYLKYRQLKLFNIDYDLNLRDSLNKRDIYKENIY